MIVSVRTIGITLLCAVVATAAAAQGNSGSAPGQQKDKSSHGGAAAAAAGSASPATSVSSTSAPATSGSSALYYGSWLDDASTMTPGSAWMGLSTAYWKSNTGRQLDAPVMMGAIGVSPRTQIGASLPIYHFRDAGGFSANGVGTISMYGKLMLVDPAGSSGVGLAMTPLLQLAPASDQHLGWALPVNVEARMRRARIYGSTGYFSRGSVFATVAADVPAGRKASFTGNFGRSFASGSHETDLGAGLALFTSPTTSVFISLGRAFMSDPAAAGGMSLGGGVSLTLPRPVRHP